MTLNYKQPISCDKKIAVAIAACELDFSLAYTVGVLTVHAPSETSCWL